MHMQYRSKQLTHVAILSNILGMTIKANDRMTNPHALRKKILPLFVLLNNKDFLVIIIDM
jgi:hypothetical protein